MAVKVVMPPLGEVMNEGTVFVWYKQEGEQVRKGEPLLAVETDKTTMDVEALSGGVVLKILVQAGAVVEVGTVLAWIGQPGESVG